MSAPRVWPMILVALIWLALTATADAGPSRGFAAPAGADQLIVVSSPNYDPAGHVATLRAYFRATPTSPWHRVFGPWPAEIGNGDLRDHRREGDGSTPTGVYDLGSRIYGADPNPGGLHYAYHRLTCGDWWDEDPYSPRYNRFVHVRCGIRPGFATGSEALWTETVAYSYFAVIRFNVNPIIHGRDAPGSAIFLHSWVAGPTAGCVALPTARLLALLQWLRPTPHPAIAIGTRGELGAFPSR